MSDTQKIQDSQHILHSSHKENVDIRLDFSSGEEDNADVLDLGDDQLKEGLTERTNDQAPKVGTMEGLVQQPSDYVMSASELCELVNHHSLVPARKPSHDEVPIMSYMS